METLTNKPDPISPEQQETKAEFDLSEYFATVLLVMRDGQLQFVNSHPDILIIMHDYDHLDPVSVETDLMKGERYSVRYTGRPETLEKLKILVENFHVKNSQTDLQGRGDDSPDSGEPILENDKVSTVHDS